MVRSRNTTPVNLPIALRKSPLSAPQFIWWGFVPRNTRGLSSTDSWPARFSFGDTRATSLARSCGGEASRGYRSYQSGLVCLASLFVHFLCT